MKNTIVKPTMPPRKSISVEIGGVTHSGRCQTEKKMIRVSYGSSSKVTQLGDLWRRGSVGAADPVRARAGTS